MGTTSRRGIDDRLKGVKEEESQKTGGSEACLWGGGSRRKESSGMELKKRRGEINPVGRSAPRFVQSRILASAAVEIVGYTSRTHTIKNYDEEEKKGGLWMPSGGDSRLKTKKTGPASHFCQGKAVSIWRLGGDVGKNHPGRGGRSSRR